MLTGYAAVISMIKAAMIDEAIGRGIKLSVETEPIQLCRRKTTERQRTALTTTDLTVRLRYLHLAKLWREMAEEAKRQTNGSS